MYFTIQEFDKSRELMDEYPDLDKEQAIEKCAEIRRRNHYPAVKHTPGLNIRMAQEILERA